MGIHTLSKIFNKAKVQVLLISLIAIASYFNILQNGISYDDRDFLLNWPTIRDSESGLSAFLSLPDLLAGDLPEHHRGVYRPIRSVYYLFSLKLWGYQPFFFHLQAIITHTLIVTLIYFITKLLSKNKILSFVAAALFAAHPIHTEAVTYTSASFDTLGILFFFASFYFYLRSDNSKENIGSTSLLSYLFAFLAFFTYEMTLSLPFLIIFYELFFKKLTLKKLLAKTNLLWPYFAVLLGYIITRSFILKIGNRADYLGEIYLVASNQAKIATPEIILLYLNKLLFPFNLTVAHDMPTSVFETFVKIGGATSSPDLFFKIAGDIGPLVPITIVGLLILIPAYFLKKQSLILFGWGWLLLSLLPTLNVLPQGTTVAERFLYIPSFGFCLILATLFTKLTSIGFSPTNKTRLILASTLLIVIISSYITLTISRNKDWQNEQSIFQSARALSPTSYVANGALGTMKLEEKKYDEAIQYFLTALITAPSSSRTRHQLAVAYEEKGDLTKAIEQYNETLIHQNDFFYANLGLGSIYRKQGKYEEAILEYNQVFKTDPNNFDAHFNIASAYTHQKDYPKAITHYESAIKLKPNSALAYLNLGYIYEQLNDPGQAITQYKKAIGLEPTNFYPYLNLALLYEKTNNPQLALLEFKKASSIMPDDKNVKDNITRLESNIQSKAN